MGPGGGERSDGGRQSLGNVVCCSLFETELDEDIPRVNLCILLNTSPPKTDLFKLWLPVSEAVARLLENGDGVLEREMRQPRM